MSDNYEFSAFTKSKKKYDLEGKVLNWEVIAFDTTEQTKTFTSSGTPVTDYLVSNWNNYVAGWDETYSIIRIGINITELSFSGSSGDVQIKLNASDVLVDFKSQTSDNAFELDTDPDGLKNFEHFFYKGKVTYNANGTVTVSTIDEMGNEKDPLADLKPFLYHTRITSGTIKYKLYVVGAVL